MSQSFLARMVNVRIFEKSPVNAYVRLNKWIWDRIPASVITKGLLSSYGNFLHTLVLLQASRRQFCGTFFLRNRPELELIRRLSDQRKRNSTLTIAVLGCSNGAEVYSILWIIGSARPDLKVVMSAIDISKDVLELAQKGVYSLQAPELVGEPIFDRITAKEMQEMFDRDNDQVKIKSWIEEGIIWHLGDAGDPKILDVLGPQDMVVANNFLCHMDPPDAEKCLRNIVGLVKPGGYLFVSGVDLEVRTKVARELGLKPVLDLMEDIHDGDSVLRDGWPFRWWGLEPLNKRRHDWKIRYASVFQLSQSI